MVWCIDWKDGFTIGCGRHGASTEQLEVGGVFLVRMRARIRATATI